MAKKRVKIGAGQSVGWGETDDTRYEIFENAPPPPRPQMQAPSEQQTQAPPTTTGMQDYYKERPGEVSPLMKRRIDFEQFLIQRNKVPVGVTRQQISQEVNRRSKQREEELFLSVFGGQYRFEDLNELGPQENSAWRKALLQDRKKIESGLIQGVEIDLAKHQNEMKIWDETIGKAPKEPDELNRQLERWKELKKTGQENSFEANAIEARINKLSSTSGMSFEVLPDGTVRMTQGALGDKLPSTQKFQQTAQLDRYDTVVDIIDTTLSNIEQSPTRAGVIGSIRGFAQKVAGVAGDIAPKTLAETMRKTIEIIPGITPEQKNDLSGYFDPAIPENEIYENTIALELAKLRVTSGGGGIRAIDRAFKAAQKDVKITGMFSSNEVMARLKKVREEFTTERGKQSKRLTGGDKDRKIVKTGIYNGRKVVEYSDGEIGYAD